MSFNKAFAAASTLRWLYVDFNSYFASVEQQLRPELRGRPVAVVPVETDATCAIAASYEAKAFGIRTGTPVHEAKRMCPGLVCVLANHERYVEFHHRIIDEVERHIPVSAVCSIDEVAARLMDNETSVEKVTGIAHAVKQGLARNIGEYVRCSIGIAANRYLAKVATDLQKPDGFTVLGAADLPQRLYSLGLRDLPGIGRNMEHRLRMQGIGDMQTLLALDSRQMRHAWGSVWGEKMWYFLRGFELPDEETTRRSIGHSHVMSPELRPPAQAKFVARRLMLKTASRLRRIGCFAQALSLGARLENGPRLEASTRCYRAQDTFTFLRMMDRLWERILSQAPTGARIKKVSVTVHDLVAGEGLQPDLFAQIPDFDPIERGKSEKISTALDKINHRFGRDSVLVGMLPSQGKSFSGSKIAFTRIPDIEEFLE